MLRAYLEVDAPIGKCVAQRLERSHRTIETHRRFIYDKLHPNLFRIAYEMGRRDAVRGELHVRDVPENIGESVRFVFPEAGDLACLA